MGLSRALAAVWLLVGVIGWFAWLGPQGHLDLFVIVLPPAYGVVLGALTYRLPDLRRARTVLVGIIGLACVLWLLWLLPIWFSDTS